MSNINATIVADSINPQGDRLTTMLVTFPRFILAELNTHRMLSKNSASSRAIPFKKMVESVQNNPFIPIAWQKDHSGMQGIEYLTDKDSFEDEYGYKYSFKVIKNTWLKTRDEVVKQAKRLNKFNVTKQLANRILEPFMYHTVLISGTEWENFFSLRCPQYNIEHNITKSKYFRSWKDLGEELGRSRDEWFESATILERLSKNKGMAEIHMMALAESMWDAMNESKPKQLKPGEWHIPFESKINEDDLMDFIMDNVTIEERMKDDLPITKTKYKVKIATAMAARTSYTVVGDEKEFSYEKQIELHDRMANQVPFHASPFEHCARAMSEEEYQNFRKGYTTASFRGETRGWCNNFKGFIQYRYLTENEKN